MSEQELGKEQQQPEKSYLHRKMEEERLVEVALTEYRVERQCEKCGMPLSQRLSSGQNVPFASPIYQNELQERLLWRCQCGHHWYTVVYDTPKVKDNRLEKKLESGESKIKVVKS